MNRLGKQSATHQDLIGFTLTLQLDGGKARMPPTGTDPVWWAT
jgi:hypothetical protein